MDAVLPTLPVLAAFTMASLILAATPGPDMTLFVSNTLSSGKASGIATLLGTGSGCLLHTLAAGFGISALIAASPAAFTTLKIVGALYLLWLAVRALRSKSSLSFDVSNKLKASLFQNYMMGVGINILNPKIILFFMTFLSQFVSVDDPDAWKKTLFLGTYFVALTTPLMIALILMVEHVRDYVLRHPKILRLFDYLSATVFSVIAMKILFTQAR